MLLDDHSEYTWMLPCRTSNTEKAAQAIIDWSATFVLSLSLISDGQSYFKNETMRLLVRIMTAPHHFTQLYCPWSNGAVKRLGENCLHV